GEVAARGPAGEPDQNDRGVLRCPHLRGRRFLCPRQLRQDHARHAGDAQLQKTAARKAVAIASRGAGVDPKHGVVPPRQRVSERRFNPIQRTTPMVMRPAGLVNSGMQPERGSKGGATGSDLILDEGERLRLVIFGAYLNRTRSASDGWM